MSVLLQGAGLFGVVGLLIGLVVLLATLGVTYWVYKDATGRNNDRALLWTVGTLIGFLIGLIPGLVVVGVYLFVRD